MTRENKKGAVLVTGASGFLGGHLALRLLKDGERVRVLIRNPEKGRSLEKEGAELRRGDLKDMGTLIRSLEGVDRVFHMAALFRKDPPDPGEYYEVNDKGTENLIGAAKQAGVLKFIHCSTVGVHGNIENPPADENAPFLPEDEYQRSKLAGEERARKCFSQQGPPGVIFRPAGIYGPGDTRFLKLFRMIQKRRFLLFGGGAVLYHMTYIDDLVDGVLLLAEKDEALGKTFILAGGNYLPLKELIRIIAEELGVAPPKRSFPLWPLYVAGWTCEMLCKPLGMNPPLYRRRLDFFSKDRAFDISRAQRILGYKPKVPLREGIGKTAQWYREKGWIR